MHAHMQAGIGATVLLVLLRIVQGLAVGGEFTGTMVSSVHASITEAVLACSSLAIAVALMSDLQAPCDLLPQVFLVESAPPDRQGLHGSFAFTSVMTGVILGSLVAVGFNSLDGERPTPRVQCSSCMTASALPT
jgi:MHS family proline/betaine transporter-like MFS transporter